MPHQEILSFISTSLPPPSSTTIFNSGSTRSDQSPLLGHRSRYIKYEIKCNSDYSPHSNSHSPINIMSLALS